MQAVTMGAVKYFAQGCTVPITSNAVDKFPNMESNLVNDSLPHQKSVKAV